MSELEERITRLERRLAELEGRDAPPPPFEPMRVAPPPFAAPPIASAPFEAPPKTTWYEPPRPKTDVANAEAVELQFGRRVLPWVGALAVCLGLAVLTSLLIQSGAITPFVQFCLAVAACLGLFGLGEWLYSKRHPLTNILLGLASFGGFLTIVGGATTFAVYRTETALWLLLAFSAMNAAYSAARKWQVFTGFALAGGLWAAVLAAKQPTLGLTVAFVTGAIAAFISVRNKWPFLVWASYLGTVALVSLLWQGSNSGLLENVLYQLRFVILSGLMLAYILRQESNQERSLVVVPAVWPVMIVWITQRSPDLVFLGWGGAMLVLAWFQRRRPETYLPLLATGLTAVTVLETLAQPKAVSMTIWLALAAVAALANLRFRTWLLAVPALVWQVLSIGSWFFGPPVWWLEPAFWLVQTCINAVLVYGMWREPIIETADPAVKVGILAAGILPLTGLTAFTALRLLQISDGPNLTVTLLILGGGYSLLGLVARNLWLRYLGWIGWAFLVLKIMTTDFWELTVLWRSVTLLATGALALAVAAIYIRRNRPER